MCVCASIAHFMADILLKIHIALDCIVAVSAVISTSASHCTYKHT